MAMLAEPRRKQRIGPNPRGKFFTDDQDNRGRQMLEKMGWKSGDGLGANSQGMNEPIKPKVHTDARGLGFDKKTDPWVAHNEEFEQLLKSLNSSNSNGTDDGDAKTHSSKEGNSAADEDSSGVINGSLEKKSKTLRSRIHYHKFVKNKDLSRASSKDISCIFGKSIDKLGNVFDSPKYEETKKTETASNEHVPQVQLSPSEPVVNEYLDEKVKKKKKKKRDRDGDCSKDESGNILDVNESFITGTSAPIENVHKELDEKLDGDSAGGKKKKRRRDKVTDKSSEEEEAVPAIDIEKPTLSNQTSKTKTNKKKKRDRDVVGCNRDASTDIVEADESCIEVSLAANKNVDQELDVKLENDSERKRKKKRRKDKETEGIDKSSEESVPLIQNDIENPALPDEDNSVKKKKRKSKLKDEEEKSENVITTTEIPEVENDSLLDSSQKRKKKKSKKRKLDAAEDVCKDTIQENITNEVNIDEDDSKPKKKKKKSRKDLNEHSVDCTHVTSPLESNTIEDPTLSDSKTKDEPTKPIENSETFGSMQFINRGSLEDYFRNKRLQMLNRKLSK